MKETTILLIGIIGLSWVLGAQTQGPASAPLDPKVLQSRLLRCQAEMQMAQADILDGKLSDVASFVKRFEAANPGQTLDATLKVIAKDK